ncbi:MAG: hypothetical protein HYY09_04215 [Firmicutes bacterium]|nr:hypothetical protein [Bacillota bacterium]
MMIVGGFVLQALSYFVLATPLGTPSSPVFSDPRLLYAPVVFIIGVMSVFLAVVVYEVVPEKEAVRENAKKMVKSEEPRRRPQTAIGN